MLCTSDVTPRSIFHQTRNRNNDINLGAILLVICLMFVICQPLGTFLDAKEHFEGNLGQEWLVVVDVSQLLLALNSATNFVVYALMGKSDTTKKRILNIKKYKISGKKFRQVMFALLGCKDCSCALTSRSGRLRLPKDEDEDDNDDEYTSVVNVSRSRNSKVRRNTTFRTDLPMNTTTDIAASTTTRSNNNGYNETHF